MINLLKLLLQIPVINERVIGFLLVIIAMIYIGVACVYIVWKASKNEWDGVMVHVIYIFVLGILAWAGMYIGS